MTIKYQAWCKGTDIICEFTPDRDLENPVFCFSLMAPAAVISGGEQGRRVGGYCEAELPDLAAGQTHRLVVGYANKGYRPVNRAWLPLGPYLRLASGTLALSPGPSGAEDWQPDESADMDALRLLPPPLDWQPTGSSVRAACFNVEHPQLSAVDQLSQRQGMGAFLAADGVPLVVEHDEGLAADHYRLQLRPDQIILTAGGPAGVFYGGVTLLNLVQTYGGILPGGVLSDGPRFEWRGQHLDCARHYYAPETIFDLLDLMALMKLNRLHWHFADDEAFRLELSSLPELQIAATWRGEGEALPGLFGGGVRSGGSYSPATARQLIDHGRALHIEIMPEIEVPAHALALNAAIPGMRDPDDAGTEVSVQGYAENTINPALPKTWTVLEKMVDELAELFPFRYLHLGCDELPEGTWQGSPLVDQLKAREGLSDTDDVQGWTMARLAAHVVSKGKAPAAWEEAARGSNGGIGNGALLFSWTGSAPGIAAAKNGYDVVMCPAQHVYLDMAASRDPADWGAAWAAFIALEDTINWDPVPAELGAAAERIKGVQGTFWSEFTTDDGELANMLWPRLFGVACMGWSGSQQVAEMDLHQQAAIYHQTAIRHILPQHRP